ncbi:endonuclease/exonuclease/phosphatase family protein [Rhodococcus sp. NBC_00297]|uniref:endonuclease/exonuclease/phosphatase family protein n=1 Tax=Rhodococcus sp. NBC_00297 TaxID=2976005 RepID=UPI002E2B2FB6|nr:endonuclease/exonuclease/phosphatase family protein [Rhodococcus sp. NBC_00297]
MRLTRVLLAASVLAASVHTLTACSAPAADEPPGDPRTVRVATYNASMNRPAAGELVAALRSGTDPQIRSVADVVQRNAPDMLLLNEFDYSDGAVDLFRDNYLAVGDAPIDYPFAYTAPVNTGEPSGLDLDGDGRSDGPNDAWGFGQFPGQYGMVVLSKFPLDAAAVRTFQTFRWADMPDNLLPREYYGANSDALRLSSKSHWDVPVDIDGRVIHLLVSHPTPPSFDGPEDRNGRRNHDEIRLTADYIAGADYLVDDTGLAGGLPNGSSFVVLGDQNSDPVDGDSYPGAIAQLLDSPALQDPAPTSPTAGTDTADFADPVPGDLRVDYVLPSTDLTVTGSGVFWPAPGEPGAELLSASDHRLVWVDLQV